MYLTVASRSKEGGGEFDFFFSLSLWPPLLETKPFHRQYHVSMLLIVY